MKTKREIIIKQITLDLIYNIAGSILYAAGLYTFAGNGGFAPGSS